MENLTLQPMAMNPMSGVDLPADSEIFTPSGVCAKMIRFAVEDGKLTFVNFTGGCDGNLKAVSALVKDMKLEDIVAKLSGITCGKKSTSCADQLCKALIEYTEK